MTEVAASTDAWIDEVNQTVHQWGVMLGQHMKKKQLCAFEEMKNRLADLMEIRKQLLDTQAGPGEEDKRKEARREAGGEDLQSSEGSELGRGGASQFKATSPHCSILEHSLCLGIISTRLLSSFLRSAPLLPPQSLLRR